MVTNRVLCVLSILWISGCYATEDVCVGADCGGAGGTDDGEIPIDGDPGAPDEDADGDGTSNSIDTDDDDDGIQDDADVDIDGDGLVEGAPSTEVVAAAREIAHMFCEIEFNCSCMWGGLSGGGSDDVDLCASLQTQTFLPEVAQAAATAGAAVSGDQASFETYHGCPVLEKDHTFRVPTVDELMLPRFHGTRTLGERCFTRWDCSADGRCEGLDHPDQPATCALRPVLGGPCAATEPYCPADLTCTVTDDGTRCDSARRENEFCRVFELGARVTDDCEVDLWCDEDLETPACRPALREGDPCQEDRQCMGFACDQSEAACPPWTEPPVWQGSQEDLRESCEQMFPTADPVRGE